MLHIENKLTQSVAIRYLAYIQNMQQLEMKKSSERSLYRTKQLVDSNQVIDFSSAYVVGKKADFGYSRDKRPDELQINFGISTGINGIPTALTIQEGNVPDTKHMKV